jgi:DNA recombination protein RmuC
MQYGFRDGVIVDAAILLQDKIISIDSKFSLENYERILNSRNSEEREKWEKIFKQDLKDSMIRYLMKNNIESPELAEIPKNLPLVRIK